jgi:5-methylcytosine-specific restriction endonuclease McrA
MYVDVARAVAAANHIVPKRVGGEDSLANLQSLCHEHHSMKTARETGLPTRTDQREARRQAGADLPSRDVSRHDAMSQGL